MVSTSTTASHLSDSVVNVLLLSSVGMALAYILLAFLLAAAMYAMRDTRWNRLWHWVNKHLLLLFFVTWILGFCVYAVGMYVPGGYPEHPFHKLFAVSGMAILHAFGMFALLSDISSVHTEFTYSVLYMTWFSSVHFLAALVSMVFVIKHFGYNIIDGMKLSMAGLLGRRRDSLYIFWGINNPGYILAQDIKCHAPESLRLIFVKTTDEDNLESERTGLNRLFNFLSIKNRELDELKNLKCYSASAFSRLSKCDLTDQDRLSGIPVLRSRLGLYSLVRLLRRTTRQVHVLMLSDDQECNIRAAMNLCADADLRAFATAGRRVTIHCRARYDSVNRVVEDLHYAEALTVRVVDSSHMSVELLKTSPDPLCRPVGYVRVNPDATVSTSFRGLILGMGECGRDALRYLYEYGAFVAKDGEASDFRCDVFDRQMSSLAPLYRVQHAGVDYSRVCFHEGGFDSQVFWDFVEAHIREENCIFISARDDESGLTLAVRLLKLAMHEGADMERLRIFVRSYRDELLPQLTETASHYNEGVVRSLHLQHNLQPIYIFGRDRDLYSWRNIIDNSLRKQSFCYFNGYHGIHESPENLGTAWQERRLRLLPPGEPCSFVGIQRVRREEFEDMENATHSHTKLALIRQALQGDEAQLQQLAQAVSSSVRQPDNSYGIPPAWERIMTTLAQTEHLRWNASHQMLGYTYDPEVHRDDRDLRMRHDSITSWADIATRGSDAVSTLDYDYQVVETTLRMYLHSKR